MNPEDIVVPRSVPFGVDEGHDPVEDVFLLFHNDFIFSIAKIAEKVRISKRVVNKLKQIYGKVVKTKLLIGVWRNWHTQRT